MEFSHALPKLNTPKSLFLRNENDCNLQNLFSLRRKNILISSKPVRKKVDSPWVFEVLTGARSVHEWVQVPLKVCLLVLWNGDCHVGAEISSSIYDVVITA